MRIGESPNNLRQLLGGRRKQPSLQACGTAQLARRLDSFLADRLPILVKAAASPPFRPARLPASTWPPSLRPLLCASAAARSASCA